MEEPPNWGINVIYGADGKPKRFWFNAALSSSLVISSNLTENDFNSPSFFSLLKICYIIKDIFIINRNKIMCISNLQECKRSVIHYFVSCSRSIGIIDYTVPKESAHNVLRHWKCLNNRWNDLDMEDKTAGWYSINLITATKVCVTFSRLLSFAPPNADSRPKFQFALKIVISVNLGDVAPRIKCDW